MKTSLRTLRVGTREFRWAAQIHHVTEESDWRRCARVRIWGCGKNSRVLRADLLSTSDGGPWGLCATDVAYPTPRTVRALIDFALERGWDPTVVGGRWQLGADTELRIPGFRITDRRLDLGGFDPESTASDKTAKRS
jgi:hypothetical protein